MDEPEEVILAAPKVQEAFAAYLEPVAPGSRMLIEAISAVPVREQEGSADLEIDKASLLAAILQVGNTPVAKDAEENAAHWIVDWIQRTGSPNARAFVQTLPKSKRTKLSGNSKISLSADLKLLMAAAVALANRTGQPFCDLRHIVIASTLKYDPLFRDIRNPMILRIDLMDLRRFLIARFIETPLPGDQVVGWDSVLDLEIELFQREPAIWKSMAAEAGLREADLDESLPTLSDQPATTDALGRHTFARVLAERLREAHAESAKADDLGAFMAHIHGPWGYGKSSVLNFLRTELEKPPHPWLIVEFNAWKHHRLRPPWWSLISAVYVAALKSPGVAGNWELRRIWWSWRLRADWLPILLVAALLGLLSFGIVKSLGPGNEAIKVLTTVLTAAAGIYAYVRFLLFGSAKAADAYAELKTDPYQPVVRLYCKLIRAIDRPVTMFIDDLDRCESDYVVELVEGIQTLLRSEPVSYVIAADRKWICSAFEKKYADFSGPIGEPGRPLGYLFLDKLFQISAALPSLSPQARDSYWRKLLDRTPGGVLAEPLAQEEAEAQIKGKGSLEALQKVIDEAPEAHKPALRAAAAFEITRAEAAPALEHRLQPFASLLEPNPRAMKRLVNAVGMAQARAFLEARDIPLDTLARWTIIELRWPLLADYLADDVETIRDAGKDEATLHQAGVPPHIIAVMREPALRAIVAPPNKRGLDEDGLRALLF